MFLPAMMAQPAEQRKRDAVGNLRDLAEVIAQVLQEAG